MRVLGIETSCDETGLAVYDTEKGLIGQVLHSQLAAHAPFGGVVPEIAARDHLARLPGLLQELLEQLPPRDESAGESAHPVDAVAYTSGPGLVGALWVGAGFARAWAYARGLPALPIHHLEGHLLAPKLDQDIQFPLTTLLVSGGHSEWISAEAVGCYERLGGTVDDAVGEAFDKTASLLGLGYPGGPALEQAARQGRADAFDLPRPMQYQKNCNMSFSGLKTAVRYALEKETLTDTVCADMAASFQTAVIDVLVRKAQYAMVLTGHPRLCVVGGVAANQALRQSLTRWGEAQGIEVIFPALKVCTDNGAMIALAGACRIQDMSTKDLRVSVRARWPLTELNATSAP